MGKGPGAAIVGIGVFLPGLHYYLWIKRSPRLNTIRINVSELARLIGVNPNTMGRKIKELVDEGRLVVTGEHLPVNQRGYTVVDPAKFIVTP